MNRSHPSITVRRLAALLLAALLAGCGGAAGATPAGTVVVLGSPRVAATPAVTPPLARTPAAPATPAAVLPVLPATPAPGGGAMKDQPAARAAVDDLARQRGVDPARIQVVAVEAVEWPDSSLGCPQPGRAYAQVITPGYRIRLTLDGQPVVYHADRSNRVILCANPKP